MELIEIVDENGDFTGQIMDKEEAHDKNLLHNEVGIFIINDDGKHFVIHGPMKESVLPDLSDFIREELGRKDLKLFDGNPGQVES